MDHEPVGDRSIAVFLLGLLAFSPSLLSLFRLDRLLWGFPPLYLYLLGAWALLIVLLAVIFRAGARGEQSGPPQPPASD